MVQVDMSVTEKAVDCLRILTTGNEANKVALLTSASGLPCLVRLMETSPDQASVRCAVLCCAVLCCAVLCCAVLCCAVLCCAQHAAQEHVCNHYQLTSVLQLQSLRSCLLVVVVKN